MVQFNITQRKVKTIVLFFMVLIVNLSFGQEKRLLKPIPISDCPFGETLWYPDEDGDGYGSSLFVIGSSLQPICSSIQPKGYVSNNDDCNDQDASITTQGFIQYRDQDNDGFGDPSQFIVSCFTVRGYVSNNNDQCPTESGDNSGCPSNQNISQDKNYIHTIVYKQPYLESNLNIAPDNDKIETITYYDALGRSEQTIGIRAGGQEQDIVSFKNYDAYGRENKVYLPYARSVNNGSYENNPLTSVNSFYNTAKYENTTNPYSEVIFEASPLGRVLEQGAPGTDWQVNTSNDSDHTTKFKYQINEVNEVKQFDVSHPNDDLEKTELEYIGMYSQGELFKSIVKNENWQPTQTYVKDNTTEEFTNRLGRLVLKRTYNDNQPHDTYYVYDDFGNLTYVIPPLAADNTAQTEILNNLCYTYHYNKRDQIVEFKIPGKEWEYIVYDELDRPILTQDALQRNENIWLFTKYNKFGKIVYTGKYAYTPTGTDNNSGRLELQNQVDTQSNPKWYEKTGTSVIDGQSLPYTNQSFPTNSLTLHAVHYYDDYNMDTAGLGLTLPTTVFDQQVSNKTKSLGTLSKVRILGTNQWETILSYYDKKGMPIYTANKNEYLNTIDISKLRYNFSGQIVESENEHTKSGVIIVTNNKYTYDHAGRVLTQIQTINEGTPELLVNNTYDELGRIENKKVGGSVTTVPENSNGLQTVNYKYNIRGWLKQINNPDNLGDDLFSLKISYNQGNNALYNGNISHTGWKTASANPTGNPISNTYNYTYDALNRITSATDNTGNYNLSGVVYDKNGNIQTLERKAIGGFIDKLTYNYDAGNKLKSVADAIIGSLGNEGFKDGNTYGDDYTYDENGNMLKDLNKGINTNIIYNHLNLPTQVTLTGGNIQYVYNAVGKKLKKIITEGNSVKTIEYAGKYIYENNVLKFFSHAKGYVQPELVSGNLQFKYVYQYKDHLGNIRLSYSDSNNDGIVTGETSSVFNDDLENSSGWDSEGALYGSSATIDGEHTISGTTAAKLTLSGAGDLYAHSNEWIPINNSVATDYIFSGWVYLESPSSAYTRIVLFMNEDNETGYATQTAGVDKVRNKNQWFYVEKRVTVPANIDKLNLRLDVYTSYSTGATAWFDNLSIRKVNSVNEIIEENNYYPFGLKHKGYNSVVSANTNEVANKFKFNGKEQEKALGYNLYEMDVRSLDPALGRWTSIDPVTHHSMSTYNAFDNNPILLADPSGADGMIGSNGGSGWALWNGMMGTQQIFADFSNVGASQFNNDAQQPNSSKENVNDPNGNNSNTTNVEGSQGSGAISNEELAKFVAGTTELAEVTVIMNNKESYDAAVLNIVGQIYATDWYDSNNFSENMLSAGMVVVNSSVGVVSTVITYKGKYHLMNERFHVDSKGKIHTYKDKSWKKFKNVRKYQIKKVQGIRNISNKLTKLGGVILIADVALSGDIKPSHWINGAMLFAATTGVGAPVAAIWFIADFGTMGVNYLINGKANGIGDMLDNSNFGQNATIHMYDGLY